MRKLPSRKLLAAIVAGALFIPQSGFTLGLGEIEVSSALNQKLRADIELLSATPEDAEKIIVKLASRKEFSRAGLDRPYALSDLRFKSEVIDGVPHIKVSSGSPIREPFLNFLVEIDWPNGHLLREYTVLLDPPVFMTAAETAESRPSAPATTESRPSASGATPNTTAANTTAVLSVAAPAQPVAPAQTNATPARSFTAAPVVHQQTPANQQSINQPPGSYKIRAGDTSWSLADAMRPDQSVTVPQMMFAMLRANPESFINENINGLKRGYILRVPDADQITSISKADAQAMMKEHWALWRQYQQEQSGGQPVSAMQPDGAAGEAAGDDLSGADSAHLAIVSAGSGTAGSGSGTRDPSEMSAQELRAELALARERVETERVEKEALQSRINTLEQNIGQREGLLVIEDEELSGVQSLNADDTAQAEAMNAAANRETDDAQSAEVQSDMAEDAGTVADTDSDQQAADDQLADEGNTDAADTEASDDAMATDAVFTDEVTASDGAEQDGAEQLTDQAIDEGLTTEEISEQATPADTTTSQPVIDEQAPSDPLTQLLNDPKMMAAAGGGLLLIVALIALMLKRRKSGEDDEPEVTSGFADLESLADDIAGEANDTTTVYTESDDESVDSEADTEAENIEEGETTAANEDEATRDDVIAEADVYLAYGIYQQAEDLLNQAIKDNPDRIEYRYKLAESYHASKNATAFVDTATEIKSRIEDEASADWNKVLVMGQELCPEESMFESAGDTELDELIADAPIMELDDDNTEGSTETFLDETDLNVEQQNVEELASSDLMDDTLELPEMDAEESHADKSTADELTAEPVEEIEFDISDTGALEDSDAAEDAFDLDIDASELDIGGLEEEALKEESQADEALEEETLDLGDIDLGLNDEATDDETTDEVQELGDTDLEFGLDDTASETDAETVAETTDTEIEEVTLDLSDEIAAESLDEAELDDASDEDMPKADIADNVTAISSESDISSAADEPVVEVPVAENSSTGLAAEEPAAEVKTIPAANDDSADEDDFDLSSLDDVDEVSTKLDLARAYLDMGDAEGTRGILEEVLIDGNDEQKQEANELLGKLAS